MQAAVFTVFAWAWLVALGTGAQWRALPDASTVAELCTTEPAQIAPAGHHPDDGGNAPAGHAGHHGPDCLLCVALATPSALALVPPRPSLATAYRSRHDRLPVAYGWRIQAPLPARGPPVSLHA